MKNVEFRQITTSDGITTGLVSVFGQTFEFRARAGEWAEVDPADPDDVDYKNKERDEAQRIVEATYHVNGSDE